MLTFLGLASFVFTLIVFFCYAADDQHKQALITIVIGLIITYSFLTASWFLTPRYTYKSMSINNCLVYTRICRSKPLALDDCSIQSVWNICKEGVYIKDK